MDLEHAYVFSKGFILECIRRRENKTLSPSCDNYYDPSVTTRQAINSNGIWLVPVGDVINSREFTTWSRDQNNACAPLSPCSTPSSIVKTRDVIHHVVALRCRPVMPRASIRTFRFLCNRINLSPQAFLSAEELLLQYTTDTVVHCIASSHFAADHLSAALLIDSLLRYYTVRQKNIRSSCDNLAEVDRF